MRAFSTEKKKENALLFFFINLVIEKLTVFLSDE